MQDGSKCGLSVPADVDIFSSITTSFTDNTRSHTHSQLKGKRALRDVRILEKILLDPDSAVLRKRILELAKQRNLLCPLCDRSNVYFRILSAIPGTRKVARYKVFPQALVNDLDSPANVRSFFFRSDRTISPHLEIIKTGTQPCTETQQNAHFVLFRLPDHSSSRKEIHLGLFHLRTIGLSFKALTAILSTEEIHQNPFLKPFRALLGRTLSFKVNRIPTSDNLPILQVAGRLNLLQHLSTFGTTSHPFGFFSQELNVFDHPASAVQLQILYNHYKDPNKEFRTSCLLGPASSDNTELWIEDIFITIDTLRPFYERKYEDDDDLEQRALPVAKQSPADSESPPPYGETDKEIAPNCPANPRRQKVVACLGNDRYLLTSVEILETMVANKLTVENPRFDLPQRDKNFKDWIREQQEKLFPTSMQRPKSSELILPT